jgi:hypothetical protein
VVKFAILITLLFLSTGCAVFSPTGRTNSFEMLVPLSCMEIQAEMDASSKMPAGGAGIYFKDRGNDFVDIFSMSFYFGLGVVANVRATQFLQAGGLWFNGSRVGFIGREYGSWAQSSMELGFPGMYIRDIQMKPQGGNAKVVNTARGQSWIFHLLGDEDKPFDSGYDRKVWQVGATGVAGLVGIDFSVNLEELLDFLLGWFSMDISRDDTKSRLPKDNPRRNSNSRP